MDVAATILVVAALGGLTMVILRLRGRPRPPTWLALLHGGIAATGVTTLFLEGVRHGLPTLAKAALVVFVLAALGGLALFLLYHLKNRALPIGLMLVHGLGALTGLTLLLVAVSRMPPDQSRDLDEPPPATTPAETTPAVPPAHG